MFSFNSVPRLGRIKTSSDLVGFRVDSFNSVPRLGRIKTGALSLLLIFRGDVSIQSLG